MKRAITLLVIATLWCTLAARAHNTWSGFMDGDSATTTADIQLTAYPNPATNGNISFKIEGLMFYNNAMIVIRNIVGATIKTAPVVSASPLQLNISDLPNGIYFYTLEQDGNQLLTKRFMVKQR